LGEALLKDDGKLEGLF